jgi:hypothetical protein
MRSTGDTMALLINSAVVFICASEWKVPKQRFDIDDVQCHESFTLPIPTELRRRPAKLGV